jgi:hypothetical protein
MPRKLPTPGRDDGFLRRLQAAARTPSGQALAPAGAAAPAARADLPIHTIRIHAIRTANDDGTEAATIRPSEIARLVRVTNEIYAPAGIRFAFDAAADFETRCDTRLNQDLVVLRDPALCRRPEVPPPTDEGAIVAARTRAAARFPDRLVVFFRYGTKLMFDAQAGHWVAGPASGGFSSADDPFVVMWQAMPEANLLAHEIGHYLHNRHTFGPRPRTIAEAAALIREYVEQGGRPREAGLRVFDYDADSVSDTPPDAGDEIFAAAGKDRCGVAEAWIEIPVTFSDGTTRTYRLQPDRGNIMSYFKDCAGFGHHLSPGQIARARAALETGNRRGLITSAATAARTRSGPR